MLKLSSRLNPLGQTTSERLIGKITRNVALPPPLRHSHVLLLDASQAHVTGDVAQGFAAVFYRGNAMAIDPQRKFAPNSFLLPNDQSYLAEGDVVRLDAGRAEMRTLYRRAARQNALLVTERCNSFCIMCSQPPKNIDDSYLVEDLAKAIPLMDPGTPEIGFTGGEPTLLGDHLIRLMRLTKNYLPRTSLHILSNGRNFSVADLARKVSEVQHHDLMFGVPVYSDVSSVHDYVVQADNAFDETIRGILNLKRYGVRVEIRVVIHKENYSRLPRLAEFLTRNLLFVDHVALMGLELIGFAKANIDALWMDPVQYQGQLVEAVNILSAMRMNVSIYNHQLCLLDPKLWKYAVKSISDWKNEYMPECARCSVRESCGGFFFSSAVRLSPNIKAIEAVKEPQAS